MTASKPADATAQPLSPVLDKTFKIGLALKGLDGVLEVIGGILLLFLSPHAIEHIVRTLTAHELREDPHDLIARADDLRQRAGLADLARVPGQAGASAPGQDCQ
jgi:uncharacterized membrane protein